MRTAFYRDRSVLEREPIARTLVTFSFFALEIDRE
jgi:hypothetical protein